MKVLSLYVVASLAVLGLGAIGTSHTRVSNFCDRCGLRRTVNQRDAFSVPYQNHVTLHDNEYHRLYIDYIYPSCSHNWRFTSGSSSGGWLRGGEIGCGAFPMILRYRHLMPRLRSLERPQVIAILSTLPPRDPVSDYERFADIIAALEKLNPKPTQAEAKQWWQKHSKLFRSPMKP